MFLAPLAYLCLGPSTARSDLLSRSHSHLVSFIHRAPALTDCHPNQYPQPSSQPGPALPLEGSTLAPKGEFAHTASQASSPMDTFRISPMGKMQCVSEQIGFSKSNNKTYS
ncbi:Hypothetical protein NTJ_08974 [Nesidiocoris tenuis]|uniref:Uncharacterized protein n=1 Tax=Nesidiocoris tenuis TaxID=355587 RepID=A0ABN7AXX1_9HEMI|nr:Hypothetical protein NTJ_08974 [Nesidiocoris tenuis]